MTRPLDWSTFLAEYHAQRPGVTEDLLGRAHNSAGADPYAWLLEGIAAGVPVVDLACGSGPLRARRDDPWIGVDRSGAELARAQQAGAVGLVRADAAALPFRFAHAPVVACSMALMLLAPSDVVLAEIRRVLAPGGTLHAIMPTVRPLTVRDRLRFLALYATLRMPAQLPATQFRRRPRLTLRRAGFVVEREDVDRFAYPITDDATADLLVDALYLPGATPARLAAAKQRVRTWIGTDIGLPLRRIVARSAPGV